MKCPTDNRLAALPIRAAFTLVELLVVIALIMILAGLAAAFLPAIGESARAAQGGTMLQQWILTAKQKALRDQVPCGLRLLPGATNGTQVTTCQFIEQPDDFPLVSGSTVKTVGTNLSQVTVSLNLTNEVAANDYLEVLGSGLMHKILTVNGSGTTTTLTLASPLPFAITTPTQQYRIVRAPRVTGDDLLQLPSSVIIDLSTNTTYGNPLPTVNSDGSYDILFAPSGEVISPGTTTANINLWVCDTFTPATPGAGDQTIIAIYVRSGATAAQPPAPGTTPYTFITDGRTSGK
jgi:Tfp pilus assembly protein FimT